MITTRMRICKGVLSAWMCWSNQLCYDGWMLWKKKRRL